MPYTLTFPVREGRFALTRAVLTPNAAPAAAADLHLKIPAGAIRDYFLNHPTQDFEATFAWPAADTIVQDTAAPRVDRLAIHQGVPEITLTEEPDAATFSALKIDGATATWTLSDDRHTLTASAALAAGSHTLVIETTLADLNGQTLATPWSQTATVGALASLELYAVADPRIVPGTTIGNPFAFHGNAMDAESGFIYMRNRYYDPEMGRFITVDPLGYVDGPNPYGFVGNDPVNGSDPLGLADDCDHMSAEASALCRDWARRQQAETSEALGRSSRFLAQEAKAGAQALGDIPLAVHNADRVLIGTAESISDKARFSIECLLHPFLCWDILKEEAAGVPDAVESWTNAPFDQHASQWGSTLAFSAFAFAGGAEFASEEVVSYEFPRLLLPEVSESTEEMARVLIDESNKNFKLTRTNALKALRGPDGAIATVKGAGVEGADIVFRLRGQTLLREIKCTESFGGFNKRLSYGAGQIEYSGEVYVQVPEGTDVNRWIRRAMGSREIDEQALYRGVHLEALDPAGNVLYSGPVLP